MTNKIKDIKQLMYEQGRNRAEVRTYFYRIFNRIDKGPKLRSKKNIRLNVEE